MKRFLMGVVWFLVFWVGINFALGLYAGISVGVQHPQGSSATNAAQGEAAGRALGHKYGLYVLIAALLLSAGGTWTRVLPGTRRKIDGAPVRGDQAE